MSNPRPRYYPLLLHALTSLLAALLPFNVALAQLVSSPHAEVAAPVHRYLVGYRNRKIPGDIVLRAGRVGATLVGRRELPGVAIVQADAKAAAKLMEDPEIEFAAEDRLVSAHVLPMARVTLSPLSARADLARLAPTLPRPAPSAPKAVIGSDGDRYYRGTPQGWAVKSIGGYGAGLAGGPVNGPWTSSTGQGVRIAILDSGVDENHPDLRPNLALSLSEIDQAALPSPCDDGSPQDQQGHGSWAASLALGAAGTATGAVVGTAPSAALLNIKVLQRMPGTGATLAERCANGQASGLMSWVLQGIDDAIAQHADVISLSLGTIVDLSTGDGAGLKASFDRATEAAAAAGVVVVASAGNEGFDFSDPRYAELPAQAREVVAAAASTNPACEEDLSTKAVCKSGPITLPYYSNHGSDLLAVAAPGGSYPEGADDAISGWVRGACSAGLPGTVDGVPSDENHSFGCFNLGHQQYVQAIGTSASAPLVAGAAALVRGAHPEWSADTVIAAIRATAKTVPGLPYGLVDAAAAIAFRP